jgi:NAD(P)-dependent dehydrogenase (short-subunit alcohol dehydrogenase family)
MVKNQKIIIIGASQGIGYSTAKLLASQDNELVVTSKTKEKIEAAALDIGSKATPKVLDFTDESAVQKFFQEIGTFDHLLLIGAGLPAWGELEHIETEALRNAFNTKFFGYFFCIKHAKPFLRNNGSILMITGGAARKAIKGTSGLAAVNGALLAMGKTLALELAPIRVNIISSGVVDTPAYDWMGQEQKQSFLQQRGKQIPVGRVGQPEEIAHAIEAVLDNQFITGSIIDVDGGGSL